MMLAKTYSVKPRMVPNMVKYGPYIGRILPEFSSDQKERHLFRYSEFYAFMAIFQSRMKRTVCDCLLQYHGFITLCCLTSFVVWKRIHDIHHVTFSLRNETIRHYGGQKKWNLKSSCLKHAKNRASYATVKVDFF